MKRKDYLKPTMRIVKLQHRSQILVGSEIQGRGKSSVENYTVNNYDEE